VSDPRSSAGGIELFGSLYGTPAMKDVFSARARVRTLVAVEAALARVQARLGIVPQTAADAIAAAADRADDFDIAALAAQSETVGYPIVPLTRELARRAGPEAGAFVHWGATTQDVLDTGLVLQLRAALALLEADLRATNAALAQRAERHRADVMAGRTHLQHALPITFGYKVAVWLAPLIEHAARFEALRARVLRVQFGGAVGTLASLGDRGREVTVALAEELALAVPDAPWHADRSGFAELASFAGVACGSLAKIAGDVVLLMQTEVAEVFEPHAPGRGGSSTMPQKRNPIASEYVLAGTRGVHALVPLMLTAIAGDHERSTGPWQSEEIALPQILVLASGVFAHAKTLAQGMRVDTVRMRRNLDATNGLIMAEAVAMALAESIGKAAAHHLVEQACSVAIDRGRPLIDVLAEEPSVARHLDRRRLSELFDPASYVGESAAVVDRVLARYAEVPPVPRSVNV
jgi:3-carboxy-cis,cis-muconate cycloisomerase